MADCPLSSLPDQCFELKRLRNIRRKYPMERIVCDFCEYAKYNAICAFSPEPDVLPDPYVAPAAKPRGPKAKDACGRGHQRAIYGRKRLTGRDAGGWSCKECERINLAKRLKAKAKFCPGCGEPITINAKQCLPCRLKSLVSKKRKVAA